MWRTGQDKKMRIVFIVSRLTNGGAEREVAFFANELAGMGEEIHIVCTKDEKDDYTVDERVHRHLLHPARWSVPKLRGVCNQFAMATQLRKIRADVILEFLVRHDHYGLLLFATMFSKTKLIYTVRVSPGKGNSNEMNQLKHRLAFWFADGVWIQTEDQRQFYPKWIQKKMFEVHNILSPVFLWIGRKGREQIARFVSAGRLHPQKNQKLLIEAFERMIRRTGNTFATLTIYGNSRKNYRWAEDELRELVEQFGLQERVFLPGRADDIGAKYKEADAFVLGSDYEGCPNALMEAMAAGMPCISTDCPTGPSMLIESGKNGLLVPVGDVEAMSRAMQYLTEHPQEANRMGNAARRRMQEWRTARELAEQLRENLRRICL